MKDDKQKLYEDQKKLLDTFLKTGAIDKAQYGDGIRHFLQRLLAATSNLFLIKL